MGHLATQAIVNELLRGFIPGPGLFDDVAVVVIPALANQGVADCAGVGVDRVGFFLINAAQRIEIRLGAAYQVAAWHDEILNLGNLILVVVKIPRDEPVGPVIGARFLQPVAKIVSELGNAVRLAYHAQGVLCPVTLMMHLAAAVQTKPGMPKNRPCVVVAGGREPTQWEAYPHHQFIHTLGALKCCENGGCWRSRTVPLGDGDEKDRIENCCVDVVGDLPRCMDMITADEVIRRIELYFHGGVLGYLDLN